MKNPKEFRDRLLDFFERTRKRTWTREEVSQKVFEMWWGLKDKAPVPRLKRKPRKKPGPTVADAGKVQGAPIGGTFTGSDD